MGDIIRIEKFLGMNEDIDTQLALGEASSMRNYRITQNYKVKQVDGYRKLFSSISAGKKIQGQWYGEIASTYYHLVACNGTLYKIVAGTPTSIGTLTNAPTYMFYNQDKVYIMNGNEYKSFDGTTLIDVVGYIPTCYTASSPTAGGTLFEDINLLTGWKRQTFSGDGTAVAFSLFEQTIDNDAVTATVSGVAKTETTDFTVNRTTGIVTFNSAPANYPNNITITWCKASATNRAEITGCKKAIVFGTRVHAFGSNTYKNRRWHSGLVSSITSAEYFPATQITNIGTNDNAITDILTQYDRQVILTDGGKAYFSYYQSIDYIIAFPVFELNDTIGNIPFGQGQIVNNMPVSIQDGIYKWVTIGTNDERNAEIISKRVVTSLAAFDKTAIKTFDWEQKSEYWVCSGTTAIVYNYHNDVWYKFVLPDSMESFVVIDGNLYFGTANGEIMYFIDGDRTFNDTAISAEWVMGFYDWGREWARKFVNNTWITIEPALKVNLDVYWNTDRLNAEKASITPIGYNLLDFDSIDFDAWTFLTSLSPTPKRVRTKAKKFSFFKIVIRNATKGYTSSILAIAIDARIGGFVK